MDIRTIIDLLEAKAPPASYGYYITSEGRYLPIQKGGSHDDCAEDNGMAGKDGASNSGWIRVVHSPGDWVAAQFDSRYVTRKAINAFVVLIRQGRYLNPDGSPMPVEDVWTDFKIRATTSRELIYELQKLVG
ncbi:MAG: hypothetical protein EOO77_22545 [Oxalobacteraceae bacterium]|nr:MAG: hypothetical protein EOO77_22545 [Oxalobacteraceae bacterium]